MHTSPRSPNRGRTFVATFVSAAFLWTLALSVSPQLHERIHPDANSVEHSCAVTFVSSGNCNYSAQAPLAGAPTSSAQISEIPALISTWVQSLFLGASIFEHAPPVLA
jgi:hypothetical protein